MKEKTRELMTVNLILFSILVLLAVFSFGSQGDVDVFRYSAEPIYKADIQDKEIGLMCNVYWGTEYIEPYLELLGQYNVKATFFIGGIWAAENPELVERMYMQGHEIANHGYNHKLASRNSAEVITEEMLKTDRILQQICGEKPVLYAPPSGDFTKETLAAAQRNGYKTIMWSIDTIDWRDHDSAKIKRRIMNNAAPGAFILTHPTAETLTALKEVLPELIGQGYSFRTISQLLAK